MKLGILESLGKEALWTVFVTVLSLGTQGALGQAPVGPPGICVRMATLEPNRTYTLATLASDEWNGWASATVNFAGRVVTEDDANTFADVWILHTDLFRWGVNEDLPNAKGPIFNVKERESFWGKGGAELRVHTRDSATKVCMCTFADARKLADANCVKNISAGSS